VSYLVDTNVLSELRKGARCDPGVAAWMAGVDPEEIYLSAVTVGEIRKGVESLRRRDGLAASALEAWLGQVVAAHSERILPVDEGVADRWGRLNVPDPVPVLDGLLAATAQVHGLTLVTRNRKDLERTGAACHNPFRR
jgi:predicted nucleic acid-binding protein